MKFNYLCCAIEIQICYFFKRSYLGLNKRWFCIYARFFVFILPEICCKILQNQVIGKPSPMMYTSKDCALQLMPVGQLVALYSCHIDFYSTKNLLFFKADTPFFMALGNWSMLLYQLTMWSSDILSMIKFVTILIILIEKDSPAVGYKILCMCVCVPSKFSSI